MATTADLIFTPATTGTFDTKAAGTDVTGAAVAIADARTATLCAIVTCKADTNTFTITPYWQGTLDGSTWIDIATSNNAAAVALATGTAGADAAVSKIIPIQSGTYGLYQVRLALRAGVTTGAAIDTYSIQYAYQRDPM